MIQKQMMMIISLFMAVIAVILATDEEQLAAEASLPYICTGWGRLGHGTTCWAPMAHLYRTRSQS